MSEKIRYSPVDTPTVLQMEAVECGAASLAMIMGYHKKYLPLSEVRVACGVSRDGSKASNVVKAAATYGFNGDGYRKRPEDLEYMKPPMILHWNFNHFLVLEGIDGDRVYLNDPAEGKRVVTRRELDQSFTGIVLVFNPKPDFKPTGQPRTLWSSIKGRFYGIKLGISYAFLAGVGLIVPGLVIPTLTRLFVDRVLIERSTGLLYPILGGLIFMALLRNLLYNLRSKYVGRLKEKLVVSNSSSFLWHVLKLPMSFFSQRYAADIGSRLEINEGIADIFSSQMADAVLDIFSILFYAILMIQYSWILTLIGIISGAINLIVLRYISSLESMNSRKLMQEEGKLAGVSISGIQLIESIKAGGGEAGFFSKWAGHHAKLLSFEQEIGRNSLFISEIPSLLTAINGIAILTIGSLEVLNGSMTIGALMGFQSLLMSFMGPVNALISFGLEMKTLQGSLDRLDDVLESRVENIYERHIYKDDISIDDISKDSSSKLKGYVELRDLTFGYSSLEEPLIDKFHLKLKPGSRVALVGMSGSGKSTITKVISGLYKEWSGEILFDGINRRDIPKEIVNNSIAVIDQEIISFEGSIRDNIKLWDKTISDEKMIQACKDAAIYEDIMKRREGFDYILREGSSGFSGGQLQRIEIARVLATDPSIVIMDEATSALDTRTEKFIDESIRKRGCTTIIVAHRLSTIRDSDEIVVLNRGKVEQRGTHEELKDIPGLYSILIHSM